ncbi:MAG: trigger factor [Ignavibacteriae bacterium]|nr:trigger factor [Ignavibacteriota bacterium]
MDVTINNLSDVQCEAEFVLTDAELQPHFEQAYKKFAPKVEIKGFRKGKVPLPMIKKIYGEAIEHDALDDIANESFRSTMTERNIEPIGRPTMTDIDFKRGEQFRFKVTYEIKPSVVLTKYKGITVEKPIHHVTEVEVNAEIERLQRANSTMLPVTLVRDEGDHQITADVQELDETGTPLIGKKTKDARFYLADETLAPEIRDALKKAEVGAEYKVRFESQHGDHSHKHHVALAVKKIEKVELPDFDDAFVKKVTDEKVTTKEEFLQNMRKDLEAYWADQSERGVTDGLIREIVQAHDVTVPESLVNAYLDTYVEDVKGRSRDKSLPKGFDEKKFRDENRGYAAYQAKWGLIRERIIAEEHLSVADEELEKLADSEAPLIGVSKEQLLQYYKGSGSTTERLLTTKLMTLLKTNAHITEKVIDEPAH